MTWYLPAGETIISPELRPLIAQAILHALDEVEIDKYFEFQVPVFDDLSKRQKIVALYKVGFGLMDPKTHAVEHTAALEGCIAALFNLIMEYLDNEISSGSEENFWRKMVKTACEAIDDEPIPENATCEDWQFNLDTLEEEILWDSDWSLAPDGPKKEFGIMPKYFITEPPLPKPGQFKSIRAQLIEFCEGIIAELDKK